MMLMGYFLYELIEGDRVAEARALNACLRGMELDALALFGFLSDVSSMQGGIRRCISYSWRASWIPRTRPWPRRSALEEVQR